MKRDFKLVRKILLAVQDDNFAQTFEWGLNPPEPEVLEEWPDERIKYQKQRYFNRDKALILDYVNMLKEQGLLKGSAIGADSADALQDNLKLTYKGYELAETLANKRIWGIVCKVMKEYPITEEIIKEIANKCVINDLERFLK